MKRIGLTGGIGSGKSVVSKVLSSLGYPVYDTDLQARLLMHQSETIREQLVAHFGPSIYIDQVLDRKALASKVFGDAAQLAVLNQIVHPVVRAHYREWVSQQISPLVFIESAILFDSGLSAEVDVVWYVQAPQALRIARVIARDGSNAEQVKARMMSQMDEALVLSRVQAVIANGAGDAILPQIERLIADA